MYVYSTGPKSGIITYFAWRWRRASYTYEAGEFIPVDNFYVAGKYDLLRKHSRVPVIYEIYSKKSFYFSFCCGKLRCTRVG